MKQHSRVGELLPEYDFSKGVRGKNAGNYQQGSNIVVLDPDLAKRFPNSEAVNQALRSLVRLQRARRPDKGPRRRAPKRKVAGSH